MATGAFDDSNIPDDDDLKRINSQYSDLLNLDEVDNMLRYRESMDGDEQRLSRMILEEDEEKEMSPPRREKTESHNPTEEVLQIIIDKSQDA